MPEPIPCPAAEVEAMLSGRKTKLHVFSDNHFDASSGGWEPKLAPGADIVVCAGDVCQGLPEAFRFLRAFIPEPTPIVTVAGNHSFYGRVMDEEWKVGRAAAHELGIHLLENEATVIHGVRFIGATLWTDYELDGSPMQAIVTAGQQMNDHRMIALRREPLTPFLPPHAAKMHAASVRAIRALAAQPFDGPTVILTHHCPHWRSVPAKYRGDPINGAFASDLDGLIREIRPDLWVHGHTHTSFDYRIGRTRILCNPHGYGRENVSGFDPELVVSTPANIDTPEAQPSGRVVSEESEHV